MKFVTAAIAILLPALGIWAQSDTPPPGLPSQPGFYLVRATGEPVRLHPAEVHYDRHVGSNLARSQLLLNSKAALLVDGKAAASSVAEGPLSLLVAADPENPSMAPARLSLVRMTVNKDRRILAALSTNAFGGSPARKSDAVEVRKETLADGHWIRVTPVATLPAGEYALAFFPEDQRTFPTTVHDFAVEPGAPAAAAHP